jgi:hypothetical protein
MPNSPHLENRDPIMEDDDFSLRYGNPIQIIHDAQKHKVDTFEPSKEHVSGTLAIEIGDVSTNDNKNKKPIPCSILRDSTICSDFYHNKDGSVSETEHHE